MSEFIYKGGAKLEMFRIESRRYNKINKKQLNNCLSFVD
jgi:hypothetical protein